MALLLNHIEHAAQDAETAPPLVVAHGLFGSARNFNSLGRKLATNRRVILLDMPNHGDSPWTDEVSYPAMAADLAETIRRLAGGRAVVMGHSMGGKAAMALALTEPDLLAGIVIADIAPVQYGHTHLGILQAMRDADLSGISRRSEGDALMAPALPDPMLRSFILQNLVIEDGRARWRLNVAGLAAGMGRLTAWPDELNAGRHSGPALALYGGVSDYVGPAARDAIRHLFPNAEFHAVPGAGHWLHAEKPAEFLAALEGWLARLG